MNLLQIHEPGQTPLPHDNVAAVGIDLGTTYSVVAIASGDNAEVVHNIHGHALVPSVVYYGEDSKIEVGYPAKKRYDEGQKGVIASVKRLMGRGMEDVRPLLGNLPYDIVEGTGMVRLKAGGREVTPVEVSAEILKELKINAERALGKEVAKAVITVPAYFDDAARAATKDAARLAGIEVLRLINEPTAAALAYGLDKQVEGIYAVYDLGGGTFDISLLKLEKGVFQVLSTAGDTALGGDDFDQAVAAWLLTSLGFADENLTSEEVGAIVALAREAKHAITNERFASITYRGKSITLQRDEFEDLIMSYVERTLVICEQALLDAKLSIADVHGVVMVGGSTRVQLVLSKVKEFFRKTPLTDVNPDEVVAIGAAIQAYGLTQGSNNLLLDVISLSLGLETMGGLTEKIIERNTPIPASVSQEFTTYQDGQTGMQIHIVQGEREMSDDNRSLARFELRDIPSLPAGIARVKVTFTVDADGLLTVTAQEKSTNQQQIVHVRPSYGLPTEQIEKMLLESMRAAKTDMDARMLVEARVEAERTVLELESALKQDSNLLSDQELKSIKQQIKTIKNVVQGDNRDYIAAEAQELVRIAAGFAQRRMDKAIASALKGAHIDKAITN